MLLRMALDDKQCPQTIKRVVLDQNGNAKPVAHFEVGAALRSPSPPSPPFLIKRRGEWQVDGGPDENPSHIETRFLQAELLMGGPLRDPRLRRRQVSTSTREGDGSFKNAVERVNGSETVATAGFIAMTAGFDLHNPDTGGVDDEKLKSMWRHHQESYRSLIDNAPGINGATLAAVHGATIESCLEAKIVLERREILVEFLRTQTPQKRRAQLRLQHPTTIAHIEWVEAVRKHTETAEHYDSAVTVCNQRNCKLGCADAPRLDRWFEGGPTLAPLPPVYRDETRPGHYLPPEQTIEQFARDGFKHRNVAKPPSEQAASLFERHTRGSPLGPFPDDKLDEVVSKINDANVDRSVLAKHFAHLRFCRLRAVEGVKKAKATRLLKQQQRAERSSTAPAVPASSVPASSLSASSVHASSVPSLSVASSVPSASALVTSVRHGGGGDGGAVPAGSPLSSSGGADRDGNDDKGPLGLFTFGDLGPLLDDNGAFPAFGGFGDFSFLPPGPHDGPAASLFSASSAPSSSGVNADAANGAAASGVATFERHLPESDVSPADAQPPPPRHHSFFDRFQPSQPGPAGGPHGSAAACGDGPESAAASSPNAAVGASSARSSERGAPPASPARLTAADPVDVSSPGAGPPSTADRTILTRHGVNICQRHVTDDVLLLESGAYSDDVVDVLFRETARQNQTQCRSVNIAIKLSEKEGSASRYAPASLQYLAKGLVFAKGGLIAFPISVLLRPIAGKPAKSDFHYSTALYSFDERAIYHADSLNKQTHTWLVENELAEFIKQCAGLDTRPTRVHVPVPKQGLTNHCGPASVMNNRRLQSQLLGATTTSTGRLKVHYPTQMFMQFRAELKTELMGLIEREQLAPLSDFAWEELKDRPSSDVFDAQIAILEHLKDDDLVDYGFGINGDPNEKMDHHGFANALAAKAEIRINDGRDAVYHPDVGVMAVRLLTCASFEDDAKHQLEFEHWLHPRVAPTVLTLDVTAAVLNFPALKEKLDSEDHGENSMSVHVLPYQVPVAPHLAETANCALIVACCASVLVNQVCIATLVEKAHYAYERAKEVAASAATTA